jgi:multicomponent Na+:H+ antiporter subunit D
MHQASYGGHVDRFLFSSSNPKLAKKGCVFITRRSAGALSIIGVPPTCGFFSEWYLIQGAVITKHWAFLTALLLSSLIGVILFFRVIEIGYVFQASHGSHTHGPHHGAIIDEAPLSMLVPTMAVAAAIILIGLYNQTILSEIISIKQEGGHKKEDPDAVLGYL